MQTFNEIETKLGYIFKNKELIQIALTHKSYANENGGIEKLKYNERLEFLGDAVLEHIVSSELYNYTPQLKEGQMSKKRAKIVCEASLSSVIKKKGFSKFIRLGKCEKASFGNTKDAILADLFEAILGAVYEDGGFDNAYNVCLKLLKDTIYNTIESDESMDFKTKLQEYLQKNGTVTIEYVLEKEVGKDHQKTFFSAVYFEKEKIGEGSGKTKKASEQQAAKMALQRLKA